MSGEYLGIKIESYFKDYYDCISSERNYLATYNRNRTDESRGTLLRQLQDRGIKTVDLRAAREFDSSARNLVIYKNPKLHESRGKCIVTIEEARAMYSNNLASKFYEEAMGITIKVLQIGSRRFRITLKAESALSLSEGKVIDIVELHPELNFDILQPIFSIDYISNGSEMVAIDFNNVQRLETLGIDKLIPPEKIVDEIKKAMIAYNKV